MLRQRQGTDNRRLAQKSDPACRRYGGHSLFKRLKQNRLLDEGAPTDHDIGSVRATLHENADEPCQGSTAFIDHAKCQGGLLTSSVEDGPGVAAPDRGAARVVQQ